VTEKTLNKALVVSHLRSAIVWLESAKTNTLEPDFAEMRLCCLEAICQIDKACEYFAPDGMTIEEFAEKRLESKRRRGNENKQAEI
jgi:hypothetical protein